MPRDSGPTMVSLPSVYAPATGPDRRPGGSHHTVGSLASTACACRRGAGPALARLPASCEQALGRHVAVASRWRLALVSHRSACVAGARRPRGSMAIPRRGRARHPCARTGGAAGTGRRAPKGIASLHILPAGKRRGAAVKARGSGAPMRSTARASSDGALSGTGSGRSTKSILWPIASRLTTRHGHSNNGRFPCAQDMGTASSRGDVGAACPHRIGMKDQAPSGSACSSAT